MLGKGLRVSSLKFGVWGSRFRVERLVCELGGLAVEVWCRELSVWGVVQEF